MIKSKAMENFNMRYNTHLKRIRTFITPEGRFGQYDYTQDPYNRPCFFTVFESEDGFIIRNAFLPEFLQRLGIATRFYKRMAIESIQITGKPLRSTQKRLLSNGETVHELSPAAVALWESLAREGYAVRIGEKNYVFKTKENDTVKHDPQGIR